MYVCSALHGNLKEYERSTGLCWLISPEPPLFNQLPFPSIEEIIFSDEFLEATGHQKQLDWFLVGSPFQITTNGDLSIRELTVGQRDNLAWFLGRRGCLTASNFGSVLKVKRITLSLVKVFLRSKTYQG